MNTLALIEQYGDSETIEKIRTLVDQLKNQVDSRILDQAEKRPLKQNEVAFLRNMRSLPPAKRLRCNNGQPKIIVLDQDDNKDEDYQEIKVGHCGLGHCGLEHQMAMLRLE